MFRFVTAFLVLGMMSASADPHWDIQYRYRQIDTTLTINDLAFPSDKRGIACGYTTDNKDKDHPLVLLTSDGGTTGPNRRSKRPAFRCSFLTIRQDGWSPTRHLDDRRVGA